MKGFTYLAVFALTFVHLVLFGAIVYHLQKYKIEADLTRIVLKIGTGITIVFLIVAFFLLFTIRWDEVALSTY